MNTMFVYGLALRLAGGGITVNGAGGTWLRLTSPPHSIQAHKKTEVLSSSGRPDCSGVAGSVVGAGMPRSGGGVEVGRAKRA